MAQTSPEAPLLAIRNVLAPLQRLQRRQIWMGSPEWERHQANLELQLGGVPGCCLARTFPIVVAAECGFEDEALQSLRRMLHEPTLWQLMPDTASCATNISVAHRLCCRAGAMVLPIPSFPGVAQPALGRISQGQRGLLSGPLHEDVSRAL